jgi:hypothetical protein
VAARGGALRPVRLDGGKAKERRRDPVDGTGRSTEVGKSSRRCRWGRAGPEAACHQWLLRAAGAGSTGFGEGPGLSDASRTAKGKDQREVQLTRMVARRHGSPATGAARRSRAHGRWRVEATGGRPRRDGEWRYSLWRWLARGRWRARRYARLQGGGDRGGWWLATQVGDGDLAAWVRTRSRRLGRAAVGNGGAWAWQRSERGFARSERSSGVETTNRARSALASGGDMAWSAGSAWRGRTRRLGALAWSTRGLAARYGELAGWVG